MNNIAFMYTDQYRVAYIAINSLLKYNKCKLILYVDNNVTNEFFNKINSNINKIDVCRIPDSDWKDKIAFDKINCLNKINFKEGDRVFVLDSDIIITDNIFDIFEREKDIDVFVTAEHDGYQRDVNGGVWAFKYSDTIKRFLQFQVEQLLNPTWEPYKEYRKQYKHRHLRWSIGQDFLNVIYKHQLPFDCTVKNMGFKYNFAFIPKKHKPVEELLKDKDIKILHFNGIGKKIMLKNLIKSSYKV